MAVHVCRLRTRFIGWEIVEFIWRWNLLYTHWEAYGNGYWHCLGISAGEEYMEIWI